MGQISSCIPINTNGSCLSRDPINNSPDSNCDEITLDSSSNQLKNCPLHIGFELHSICLASNTPDQVFHCDKCIENCQSSMYHVSILTLSETTASQNRIAHCLILDTYTLTEIQEILTDIFKDWGMQNIQELKELRQLQTLVSEECKRFSIEQELQNIVVNPKSTLKTKQQEVMKVVEIANTKAKHIEEEFLLFLTRFYTLKAKSECKLAQNPAKHHNQDLEVQKIFQSTLYLNYSVGSQKSPGLHEQNEQIFFGWKLLNQSLLQNLTSLCLTFRHSTLNEIFKLFSESFAKMRNLRNLNLNLSQIEISISGAYELAQGLKHLKCLDDLKLNLRNGFIHSTGAQYLTGSLSHMRNLSSINLNLPFNRLGDEGANLISQSLVSFINLKRLKLQLQSNQIDDQGIKLLSKLLPSLQNLRSLHLNLLFNNYEGNKEIEELTQSFSHLTHLTSLKFKSSFLSNEATSALGESLLSLQHLTRICLTWNLDYFKGASPIIQPQELSQVEGQLKLICKSIQNLSSVKILTINLRKDEIISKDLKQISYTLYFLPNLINLNLKMHIAHGDIELISKSLKSLPLLRVLQLSLKFGDGEGVRHLAESLKSLSNLAILKIHFTSIEVNNFALIESLQFLRKLTCLHMKVNFGIDKQSEFPLIRMIVKKNTKLTQMYLDFIQSAIDYNYF